jgi:hypothetical protein
MRCIRLIRALSSSTIFMRVVSMRKNGGILIGGERHIAR